MKTKIVVEIENNGIFCSNNCPFIILTERGLTDCYLFHKSLECNKEYRDYRLEECCNAEILEAEKEENQ